MPDPNADYNTIPVKPATAPLGCFRLTYEQVLLALSLDTQKEVLDFLAEGCRLSVNEGSDLLHLMPAKNTCGLIHTMSATPGPSQFTVAEEIDLVRLHFFLMTGVKNERGKREVTTTTVTYAYGRVAIRVSVSKRFMVGRFLKEAIDRVL